MIIDGIDVIRNCRLISTHLPTESKYKLYEENGGTIYLLRGIKLISSFSQETTSLDIDQAIWSYLKARSLRRRRKK